MADEKNKANTGELESLVKEIGAGDAQGAAPSGSAPVVGEPGEIEALPPGVKEQAEELARWGWDFCLDRVSEAAPVLSYPSDVRSKAVAMTTPVLVKHWDKFPEWFKRWREEIALGMFVGGLIAGAVKTVRADLVRRKKEAEKGGANDAKEKEAGTGSAAS